MNTVYFMNNGDFDVRAMLTMGVSAKAENAIGFFGTGFKYAVAIILRLGGSIKISTQSGEYEFTAKRETIRDKEFSIVYMNDREAGFTTHLGTNWEPWMAYRELYCNAKDEGGIPTLLLISTTTQSLRCNARKSSRRIIRRLIILFPARLLLLAIRLKYTHLASRLFTIVVLLSVTLTIMQCSAII